MRPDAKKEILVLQGEEDVNLDQYVVQSDPGNPDRDIVRKLMVRKGTGVRSDRFRNRREFITTNAELMKIPNGDRIGTHPRFPLTAAEAIQAKQEAFAARFGAI